MRLRLIEEPALLGDVEIWDVVVDKDPNNLQVAWFFDKALAKVFVELFNQNEEQS